MPPIPPARAIPEDLRALLAQHDQLQGTLRALVDALADATLSGGDVRAAHRSLGRFLRGHLLPFIAAEESSVLPAGASVAHLAPLVEALLREHRQIKHLAAELTESASGPEALAAASALLALIEVHVEIENDVLLPTLVDAGAQPKELRTTMSEQLSTGPADHSAANLAAHTGEQVVDTRVDAGGSCAQLATTAVDALAVGGSFVLVADHDPRGINYMLRAERPGTTSWDVLEDGPTRWQVRIGRTAAVA